MEALIFGLLAFAALTGLRYASARQIKDAHRQAAEKLGMVAQLGRTFETRERIDGVLEGFDVRIESREGTEKKNSNKKVTCFEVDSGGLIPNTIKFSREGFGTTLGRIVGRGDLEVGDADFDRAVFIQGPSLILYAVLDAKTRSMLQRHIEEYDLSVGEGRARAESTERVRRAEIIVGQIKSMAVLTERLCVRRRDEIPARLRRNVESDPFHVIRGRCLSMLLEHYPDHDQTALAAEVALQDSEPEVRVLAAEALGAEGLPVLWSLVSDARATDEVRARAFSQWSAQNVAATTQLEGVLQDLGPHIGKVPLLSAHLFRACLQLPPGDWSTLDALLGRLAPHVASEAAEALAHAVVHIAQPGQCTPTLLAVLSIEHLKTRLIAAEALGRLGDRRALAPLERCTQGLLTDGELKRTARAAMEAIDAREAHVQLGGLSVVDECEREGALSFDERGKLSEIKAKRAADGTPAGVSTPKTPES
ncbi:MAG: hypothetical protein ACE366_18905 [Bradymonadia bacterium]